MNKKLLFAAMSLAALTACSTDDFESQQQVAEGVSPIQFEVINNDGDITRASMNGNKVVWKASDGDLFTLYHGGEVAATAPFGLSGVLNATYTAQTGGDGEPATLTTPSMINKGAAIMVWPVDTVFRYTGGNLSIQILANQTADIENHIPYVSDIVDIKDRVSDADPATYAIGADNTAGYNRKYPVFMRPMASQLIVKADYAGTENVLASLSTGEDAIEPIKVTSVELNTDPEGETKFTTEIPLAFTTATQFNTDNDLTGDNTIEKQWKNAVKNNAWTHVTGFGTATHSEGTLTTKCLTGNESCKFLILPQAQMETEGSGVAKAAVVVNTIYGKVLIAKQSDNASSKYTDEEIKDAWYRYVSATTTTVGDGETKAPAAEASGDNAGKFKTTANIAMGLKQTINGFGKYKATKGVAKGEPIGASATRYVKVLLNHLDMSNLHVTSDKQLRDVARVWQLLGTGNVTVLLDGDDDKEFKMSQKTIAKINEINAALAEEEHPRKFSVAACADHDCGTIVFTGGGEIAADLTFIVANGEATPVALNKGENWKWAASTTAVKKVTVATTTGISSFINRGTLVSDATATIAIYNNADDPALVTTIGFVNNGTWNITAGELNVKFDVTNNGTVNISKGAEYRQDASTFENEAETVPERYFMNDPSIDAKLKAKFVEKIGKVENKGVFAIVNTGKINNYGLIEHADVDAKTYITANQSDEATFANAFATPTTTSPTVNKLGRINLPYSNRKETQLSIKNTTANGFVSVTVSTEAGSAPTGGKLDLTDLGDYVNFCIINSGVTEVTKASAKVKYLEFNAGSTEIEINTDFKQIAATATSPAIDARLTGLIVLSPITIIRDKEVVATATYLGANLYKAGAFTCADFDAYFGNTTSNKDTKIITWGSTTI